MAYITWSGKEEALLGATAGWMTGTAIGAGGGSLVAPGPGTLLGGTAGGTAGFFTGGGVGWSVGSAEASFEMMRGEQYGRYIQAGFSHEDAAAVSTWTGAISTLPELTGVGKLLRHIPGVGKFTDWTAEQVAQRVATDVLAKQSVQRATGKLIRNYGSNMGWEISTEIFQDSVASVGQNYLAAQTGNADAHITFDQYLDDVAHTAVMTAKGVMLIGAVGPGSSYVQDYRQARRSQGIEQTMTALAERLTNSKTRTEAPETYRKFVEQVTARDGGPAINANRWDEFWQGHDEDPDAMAKRFGMDAEKLKLARELDHDVEIPPVAFAEQLAPSALFDGIVQDLKWYEGDMSPRDRDLFNANKPEIVRQIEESVERLKEAESQVDAMNIIDEVTGELIAAEFDQVTARHLAQLHRGFGVIADQLDMDPQELFDRFYGGVRRVTPEALERTKVKDPMIDPLLNRLRRDDYPTERQQRGASLMDFIDEMGGLDPSDPELSAMDFELGAMDLGLSKAKMERWRKDGRLLSEIAEVASEAGYIPDYDENMLLSALSRELGGEPVFGTRETGDPGMRDIATHMDRLAQMIDGLGLDIHEMNNDQIRAALEAADTFDQEIAGDELREMIELLSKTEEREGMGGDANEIDGILGRWGSLQPLIYGEQDFGDLQITDTVTIEGIPGDVEMTEDAANKLERVQKRKTAMKKLLECVSG
jgi:hypothetical protein